MKFKNVQNDTINNIIQNMHYFSIKYSFHPFFAKDHDSKGAFSLRASTRVTPRNGRQAP